MTKLQDFLWEYEEGKNPRKLVLKKILLPQCIDRCSFIFSAVLKRFSLSRIAENKKYFYLPKLIVAIPIQSLVVLQ